MALLFDQEAYHRLLVEFTPKVIETEEEYERVLSVAEQLTFKNNKTQEEQVLHKLLVTLVEVYEEQNYALKQSAPHEILQHILESSGTSQDNLVDVIGSREVVSEVANGKRSISKEQAKVLGDRFNVLPELFV
jgi:HTH-type transcriptional regulator/antitoxin HigA